MIITYKPISHTYLYTAVFIQSVEAINYVLVSIIMRTRVYIFLTYIISTCYPYLNHQLRTYKKWSGKTIFHLNPLVPGILPSVI